MEGDLAVNTRNQDNCSRDQKVREFVSLLTSQQARIYSYILSLAPNFNDADDILQDTTKCMWEKFDDFTLGTDFLAWARKIAYFLVMDYYRNRKKTSAFCYDEQLIQKLEQNSQKISDSSKDYQAHLKGCLKKLKQQDRKLLQLRYFENRHAKELASRFGCSIQYIYRNISRIHQLLLACIQKQLILKDSL
jgi:RNA polymerase sigma-70 factor (ECF subfamily)